MGIRRSPRFSRVRAHKVRCNRTVAEVAAKLISSRVRQDARQRRIRARARSPWATARRTSSSAKTWPSISTGSQPEEFGVTVQTFPGGGSRSSCGVATHGPIRILSNDHVVAATQHTHSVPRATTPSVRLRYYRDVLRAAAAGYAARRSSARSGRLLLLTTSQWTRVRAVHAVDVLQALHFSHFSVRS